MLQETSDILTEIDDGVFCDGVFEKRYLNFSEDLGVGRLAWKYCAMRIDRTSFKPLGETDTIRTVSCPPIITSRLSGLDEMQEYGISTFWRASCATTIDFLSSLSLIL